MIERVRRFTAILLILCLVSPAKAQVSCDFNTLGGAQGFHQKLPTGLFGQMAIAPAEIDFPRNLVRLKGHSLTTSLFSRTRGLLSTFFPRPTAATELKATVGARPIRFSRRGWIRSVVATAILAVAGTFFLASCGGGTQSGPTPPVLTPPTLALNANPTSLDFGAVPVLTTAQQTVELVNTGTASVKVTQVGVTGTGFQVGSIEVVIPPGKSIPLAVSFAPGTDAVAGIVNGILSITNTATKDPISVPLKGNVVQLGTPNGPLGVIPSNEIYYGSKLIGTPSVQPVQLTNAGQPSDPSITITDVSILESENFVVSGFTPGTLNPQGSTSFNLTYTATAGTSFGILLIKGTKNDAAAPTEIDIAIPLTGSGVHYVNLSWNQSTSVVIGSNVYRRDDTIPGNNFIKLNDRLITSDPPTYVDVTVGLGTHYTYAVTAIDSSGEESSYSNLVPVQIPLN